MVLTFSNNSPN